MGEGGGGEEKGSFSPSALSLFRFHLSPFPPETLDTQAKRRAFAVPNSVDRIKFDLITAVARSLKPSRATAV